MSTALARQDPGLGGPLWQNAWRCSRAACGQHATHRGHRSLDPQGPGQGPPRAWLPEWAGGSAHGLPRSHLSHEVPRTTGQGGAVLPAWGATVPPAAGGARATQKDADVPLLRWASRASREDAMRAVERGPHEGRARPASKPVAREAPRNQAGRARSPASRHHPGQATGRAQVGQRSGAQMPKRKPPVTVTVTVTVTRGQEVLQHQSPPWKGTVEGPGWTGRSPAGCVVSTGLLGPPT